MLTNMAALTEIQCMWYTKVNNFTNNIGCDLQPREM